jgi:hypothetical protein
MAGIVNEATLNSLGWPQLASLVKRGHEIVKLAGFHYRIAGRLDVYPHLRKEVWKWHDIKLDKRGQIENYKLISFVPRYLQEHPWSEPSPVFTGEIGDPFPGDPDPSTFKGRLYQLYVKDAKFEQFWECIEVEMRRIESGQKDS